MRAIRNRQKGAALVEFAIVVVLLFTLVFGIIEFGLLIKDYLTLSQAAREGARSAALRSDTDTVVQRVKTSALTLDAADITVTRYYRVNIAGSGWTPWEEGAPSDDLDNSYVQVRVRAEYPHEMLTGFFGSAITISAEMVMRRE